MIAITSGGGGEVIEAFPKVLYLISQAGGFGVEEGETLCRTGISWIGSCEALYAFLVCYLGKITYFRALSQAY